MGPSNALDARLEKLKNPIQLSMYKYTAPDMEVKVGVVIVVVVDVIVVAWT